MRNVLAVMGIFILVGCTTETFEDEENECAVFAGCGPMYSNGPGCCSGYVCIGETPTSLGSCEPSGAVYNEPEETNDPSRGGGPVSNQCVGSPCGFDNGIQFRCCSGTSCIGETATQFGICQPNTGEVLTCPNTRGSSSEGQCCGGTTRQPCNTGLFCALDEVGIGSSEIGTCRK